MKATIETNDWKLTLVEYALSRLKYVKNSAGGGSIVLGLSTAESTAYEQTDITKTTFTHANAAKIIN